MGAGYWSIGLALGARLQSSRQHRFHFQRRPQLHLQHSRQVVLGQQREASAVDPLFPEVRCVFGADIDRIHEIADVIDGPSRKTRSSFRAQTLPPGLATTISGDSIPVVAVTPGAGAGRESSPFRGTLTSRGEVQRTVLRGRSGRSCAFATRPPASTDPRDR